MARAMRHSGIPWIGEIPEHWECESLKFVFVERNERSTNGEETLLSLSQYTGVKPKSETEIADSHIAESYEGYKIVRRGDFVMNIMLAWNGSYAVSDYDGMISPAYCVFNFRNDKYHKKYYHYLLRTEGYSSSFKTLSRGIMDSRLRLYPEQFYTFPTIIPPLNEQQTIADFLDKKCAEIDQLVALQEKFIEELKAYKQSIITETVTKGLNPNAPMKDSGVEWIGEVPEGWKIMKLAFLTSKIGSGSTPTGGANVYVHDGIKFLRSQNIYFEGLELSDVAYISEEIDAEMKGTRVQSGDVLLNITGGSIGRCYFVDDTLGRANVNQHVSIIRPKNIRTKYLKYQIQSFLGQHQIAMLQTGGNREGLSATSLSNFKILYPDFPEQQAIADYLDKKCAEIDQLIALKQKKADGLKEYKKSIIYEYVTGKKEING